MTNTFRFFVRKNFPEVPEMSDEELDEIGIEFEKYLNEKLNDDQKELILPKSMAAVIMNESYGNKNGFHPAYVLHFLAFVEKMKNDLTK